MQGGKHIVSILFHIESIDGSRPIRRFSGFMVRTYLYKFLQRLLGLPDIHSSNTLKMYSVTPFYSGYGDRVSIYGRGDRVGEAYFKINLLSVEEPIDLVRMVGDIREIEVDTHRFRVRDIALNIVSYSDIVSHARPIKKFRMSFLSPTSLRSPSQYIAVERVEEKLVASIRRKSRSVGCYIPLPHPELIFKNLLRMFRSFSGLGEIPYHDIRNYIAEDGVSIAGYPSGIKTMVLRAGPGEIYIGFRGTTYFRCVGGGGELTKYVAALLRFSEYSNIGVGRTAGMGWVATSITE